MAPSVATEEPGLGAVVVDEDIPGRVKFGKAVSNENPFVKKWSPSATKIEVETTTRGCCIGLFFLNREQQVLAS